MSEDRFAWRLAPFDLIEEQLQADREGCDLRVALRPIDRNQPVRICAYRLALYRGEWERIYAIHWQKREPMPPDPPEATA